MFKCWCFAWLCEWSSSQKRGGRSERLAEQRRDRQRRQQQRRQQQQQGAAHSSDDEQVQPRAARTVRRSPGARANSVAARGASYSTRANREVGRGRYSQDYAVSYHITIFL